MEGGEGNNPPSSPRHFHLGYCFLIWASSLKISVAQLAIMHKKLIWDPEYTIVDFFYENGFFQSNITLKVKLWDTMRSQFHAKHIKDSMFIEDLSRWLQWHQYFLMLEINNNLLVSHLLLEKQLLSCVKIYRKIYKSLINSNNPIPILTNFFLKFMLFNATFNNISVISC